MEVDAGEPEVLERPAADDVDDPPLGLGGAQHTARDVGQEAGELLERHGQGLGTARVTCAPGGAGCNVAAGCRPRSTC